MTFERDLDKEQRIEDIVLIENIKQKGEMFLKEIHNSEKPIENIIFSPMGTVFVTCQNDKRVVVYDSLDYTVVHDFQV
jgi:hypothetical protein